MTTPMLGHGELHYPGHHAADDIVGRIVGPTTLGQMLVIYAADYDAERDVTNAHCRPATQAELEATA